MALPKKIYGVERLKSAPFSGVHGVHGATIKNPKPVAPQSELGHVLSLELKLQFVRNQGDEFRIGGFSFGVADGVAKEALQGIQIAPIPGNLDGVADSPLYPGWGSAEVFGYLRIEHFRDGIRVPGGPRRGFQKWVIWKVFCEGLIALFVARCFLSSSGL